MRVLAASTALAPALGGGLGPAEVIASRRRAAYLRVENRIIGVELPDGARLPISLVVDRLPRTGTTVDLTTIRPASWWDPTVPRLRSRPAAAVLHQLRSALPPATDAGEQAVDHAIRSGDPARLVGLGPGSTPAGDDLLAGRLVALHALGANAEAEAIGSRLPLGRTTALSAELLRHAIAGHTARPLRRLLLALDADAREPSLDELLGVGATSGAWLARGLLDVLQRRVPDPHDGRATVR